MVKMAVTRHTITGPIKPVPISPKVASKLAQQQKVSQVQARTSITDKIFVLTGAMRKFRSEVAHDILDACGQVAPAVRWGVDYVVQADSEWGRKTTKIQQAERMGIKVISEANLYGAIRGVMSLP